MAVTVANAADLAAFAHRDLYELASYLSWGPADFAGAVDDALLAYSVDDPSTLVNPADVALMRALVRVAALRRVKRAIVTKVDFARDGQTVNRSQMLKAVESALADARDELVEARSTAAAAAGDEPAAVYTSLDERARDPYSFVPERDRLW